MPDESKSLDVLGIKDFGESLKIATQGTVDGAAAFFGRICLPAAEEFGFLLRDKVHTWRTSNVKAMAHTAEKLIGEANVQAHPRLVSRIVNEASWVEDKQLQDMWAGLLASSCTEAGDDDSNLLFLSILTTLTKLQCRLLNYVCEKAPKFKSKNGLPYANRIAIDISTLAIIANSNDVQRLDRELDHLRSLELIDGGFDIDTPTTEVNVMPTAIALHLYVRCQGSRQSPADFFSLEPKPQQATQPTASVTEEAGQL